MINQKIKKIIKITVVIGFTFNSVKSLANDWADEFALVMFTQPSCQYCAAMDGVLKEFVHRHHWKIKYIDRKENALLAAKFNIEVAPTVVMIRRDHPDSWLPISYGVVSVPEVEENVYRAISAIKGEIKPTQFRHVYPLVTGESQ